ncbi:histidine kinase [Pseudonocardia hispaniensis]|uniref:Histidine kinase n=1 Tax=Pseudonocardia hispaniensis TaxID=904933 RepID=A0ABW1J032_9PSEU
MTLEPAHCAGEASGPAPGPYAAEPARQVVRLAEPVSEERRRHGREQWLRRRRLERQLHDGAALRISALSLQLGLFRHRVPVGETDLQDSIDGLQDQLHTVLQELRDVAVKIYPPLLDEAGLGPALRELAEHADRRVHVSAADRRFGAAAEGAAYFAVSELLAVLPPGAGPVGVAVEGAEGQLILSLTGVDTRHTEVVDYQVRPLGGTVDVAAEGGTGTITARIPCE